MHIDISEFRKPCACGRAHSLVIKALLIERGAINKLPEVVSSLGRFNHITVVCDNNTKAIAGDKAAQLISAGQLVVLNAENLHANEKAVAELEKLADSRTDLFIAAGSGTVHDITRYVAHARGLDFISVPTAASVDGFVSNVAAMTFGGRKVTVPAVSPIAVVADSEIYSTAPQRLTASGVGDLLGKYTALADWKIAKLLTGEYLCDYVVGLEDEALKIVVANIDKIGAADPDALEQLMYALVLSGLAMQMVGNSRPASGGEHHMSHLWEMHAINPETEALHGEKVGVGCILVSEKYHKFADTVSAEDIKFVPVDIPAEIKANFGAEFAEGLLEENTPEPLEKVTEEAFRSHLDEIKAVIREVPTADELRRILKACGGVTAPEEIDIAPAIVPQSLKLSPLVRNRLTLMRAMKLLGMN